MTVFLLAFLEFSEDFTRNKGYKTSLQWTVWKPKYIKRRNTKKRGWRQLILTPAASQECRNLYPTENLQCLLISQGVVAEVGGATGSWDSNDKKYDYQQH